MEKAYIPHEGDFIERLNPAYESKGTVHSVFHTEGNAAIVTWCTCLKDIVLSETKKKKKQHRIMRNGCPT